MACRRAPACATPPALFTAQRGLRSRPHAATIVAPCAAVERYVASFFIPRHASISRFSLHSQRSYSPARTHRYFLSFPFFLSIFFFLLLPDADDISAAYSALASSEAAVYVEVFGSGAAQRRGVSLRSAAARLMRQRTGITSPSAIRAPSSSGRPSPGL